jgi:hypothetical protein
MNKEIKHGRIKIFSNLRRQKDILYSGMVLGGMVLMVMVKT